MTGIGRSRPPGTGSRNGGTRSGGTTPVDLIGDVNGYFFTGAPVDYVPTDAMRVIDTSKTENGARNIAGLAILDTALGVIPRDERL